MSEQINLSDYKINAKGALIPVSTIKEIDMLRDDVVCQIVQKAKLMNAELQALKQDLFNDITAFVDLSAEKYDTKLGGVKGNTTLVSFDGRFKVQLANQDNLVFDERLQAAKALIDECLREWTADSRPEIKALIDNAFAVDKEGKISIARVFNLRNLKIDDAKWLRAMTAISDAVTIVGSKSYVRIYERNEQTQKYEVISLDIAGV